MSTRGRTDFKTALFRGRYTYDEIKVGSKTGETLMAFDEETLQFVVVKRPSPAQPNPDLRLASIADLQREEKALRTAGVKDHPAVCRLLGAGDAEGREGRYRYLVLARARGLPIPALIQQHHDRGQPFPECTYLDIMRQLLDLLAVAHRTGVIYNDVKADHLFLEEKTGRLTVIDWGNAQFISDNGAASPADDVFQCGELLYEFVVGSKYVPVSPQEWEAAGRPAWGVTFHQSIESDLTRLISRALHPDPKQRYPTAAEMALDLKAILKSRARRPGAQPANASGVEVRAEAQEVTRAATARADDTGPPREARANGRRSHRRKRSRTRLRKWLAPAILLLAAIAGLIIAGSYARFGSAPPSAASAAGASQPQVPTSTLPPTATQPAPTVDILRATCEKIAQAARAQQWQEVIALVDATAGEAGGASLVCGEQSPAQIEAQAYFQLGMQTYNAGDYSSAVRDWQAATERNATLAASTDLLIGCATVRAENNTALLEGLVGQFGASEIETRCGFDPADHLSAGAPDLATVDLLAAMADHKVDTLSMSCSRSPCPALYWTPEQGWRFTTFYDYREAYLLFDDRFQQQSTRQYWDNRLRAAAFEFAIAAIEPNSFPYGSQVGLEVITLRRDRTIRLLAVSEPILNAAVRLVGAGGSENACDTTAVGPLPIVDGAGAAVRHSLAFQWDAESGLQFFVDDRPLCASPIPFSSAPQVALYLAGRGADLAVTRLTVTLAPR